MNTRNIQPIVEGHAEVAAVPLLLRRLRDEAEAFHLDVNRPIRQKRAALIRENSLGDAVKLALLQERCSAILILIDADDDCPKTMAPRLLCVARKVAGKTPCAVVMATCEYEAWFLAGIESLRGKCGIRSDAVCPSNFETCRGAKEKLEELMADCYHGTVDQPALSALVDLRMVYSRCRSFRHLVTAFGELAEALGPISKPWPPSAWLPPAGQ